MSKSIASRVTALSLLSAVLASPTLTPSGEAAPARVRTMALSNKSFVPTAKNYGLPVSHVPLSGFTKGILECGPGGLTCTVRNMPILCQTDPRIDSDVQDMGGVGCYNTSIVTVILTALANKSSSVPEPKNRTRFFEDIPAGKGPSGQAAPKEIEQLSQAYRWQKADEHGVTQGGKLVQPHYFHEVLADLAPIKEGCDPYVYGDCADASNAYGHAFRKFVFQSGEPIDNQTVIDLMKEGYVVMIAYARYNPTAFLEGAPSSGKPYTKVSFALENQHKVVFSGFQPGKYPLLINDVGTGQQYRVRLSTDLSGRTFAPKAPAGKAPLSNFNLGFQYPTATKVFLEYEGAGKNQNEQVFFVEHYDGLKIAAAASPRRRR